MKLPRYGDTVWVKVGGLDTMQLGLHGITGWLDDEEKWHWFDSDDVVIWEDSQDPEVWTQGRGDDDFMVYPQFSTSLAAVEKAWKDQAKARRKKGVKPKPRV